MSKLESLKKYCFESKGPDDVIMAILSQMKGCYIPKDASIIHKAIYQLKQNPDFKDLLADFSFDNSGLTPFSDLLDRVFFRLETSCILGTLNPRYEKYELPEGVKSGKLSNVFNKFTPEEQSIIIKMSDEFESRINMYQE